jgi:hypothetical protein
MALPRIVVKDLEAGSHRVSSKYLPLLISDELTKILRGDLGSSSVPE